MEIENFHGEIENFPFIFTRLTLKTKMFHQKQTNEYVPFQLKKAEKSHLNISRLSKIML